MGVKNKVRVLKVWQVEKRSDKKIVWWKKFLKSLEYMFKIWKHLDDRFTSYSKKKLDTSKKHPVYFVVFVAPSLKSIWCAYRFQPIVQAAGL